jgi:hypothetical protein
MCPCNPNDVSFDIPDGPSGPSIPGFGSPFSLKLPNINPFPDGFPEDLLDLLNKLQMLIPPGILKPNLSTNFGKDEFDAIMSLLDKFMPYLMMYKFFLPILKLILCIIEVLCAINSPIKLGRALKRLFRNCLPDFLNLFPLWALILMIISLLLLLLALIEYIIQQILKLIQMILRNLNALYKATARADANSIVAIAKKLGALLCVFQNLFVLLAIINIIFDIFRDLLSLVFAIPPCDDTDAFDIDGCCTPDVCPTIVKSNYTRTTGKLQYYNQLSIQTTLPLPGPNPFFTVDVRTEGWQLYDIDQNIAQAFINIVDGYDIPPTYYPKPTFFPTDVTYTPSTAIKQAAYTIDIRAFYNPANWGRSGSEAGLPRWVRFKDCILLYAPTRDLSLYDGSTSTISNGVARIAGGLGYEDDGTTVLTGYASDGVTPIPVQANLGTFFHKPQEVSINPIPLPTDGYLFSDIEYTFKPNIEVLWSKNLVTLGCMPDLSFDRMFVSNVIAGDVGLKLAELQNALKVENGFPDPNKTQECLSTAISGLRGNFTALGVANFQATSLTCLQKLKDDTNTALGKMVGLGFDPCKSKADAEPLKQFTSRSIKVTAHINERNGYPITSGLSPDIASDIANRLKAYVTFGEVSNFSYDGYEAFNAYITSKEPGPGQLMVSFDDNIFCTTNMPSNIDESPTNTLQVVDYQFVYAPASTTVPGTSAAGDDTGQPRRDEGDMARDAGRGGA